MNITDSPNAAPETATVPTEPEVFLLADRALQLVVEQIRPDQWDRTMPAWFQVNASAGTPTLREVINYHAYDDAWVPAMLAGQTMEEVGQHRFDGDLLGEDPHGAFSALVQAACAAAEHLTDLERTVHCSFGDYSAREYLCQVNFFRGVRARDLALVIGAEPALPAPLVRGLWAELSPHAEEWRALGVLSPAVEVPAGAPLLDRLLGLTGRDPKQG